MRNRTKTQAIFLNAALILLQLVLIPAASGHAPKGKAHFKTEIDFGSGSLFTTFLDVDIHQDQFTITSPENADVRIMGAKARLGRIAGKLPKNGTIIRIRGTQKRDSLFGATAIPMFGKLTFRGAIKHGRLTGELLNKQGTAIGVLNGAISTDTKVDYAPLYAGLIKTVTDNIYSRSVLQSGGWKRFEKQLRTLCDEARDDIEIYFGFNMLARNLPFTHLSLVITQYKDESAEQEDTAGTAKSVFFEERNRTTAYLRIKDFSTSEAQLSAILPRIVSDTAYKNLIIDLRNNGGGGVGPAFALAKYIVAGDLEVGYFVTNKLTYAGFEPGLFRALPAMQPKSTQAFGDELMKTPGVRLVFRKPENPVFSGNIYVLTNGKTASTCEPMVYALKHAPNVTVIGEKTYGGMLAAFPFPMSGKYLLMVPIADFYTYDGVRLDKVGVAPDINVSSDAAEAKALELINGGSGNRTGQGIDTSK